MKKTLFIIFVFLPLISVEANGFVVKDMRVEGLQRISEGTNVQGKMCREECVRKNV